ncbi:hypothetical protein B0J12DRAFT_600107 [Macrophomina phaseolina]|uniref:Uncharacterized protein n=1 Tax=Macrophomina phaseolina TaxID=35725 RepID=A0ABQ8GAF2_9PEZI|nr:hypothetical protein B0J12DRAFT_600107 [Macrophomina phaseolina]
MASDHDAPDPVLSLGLRQGNTVGHDTLQLNRQSFAGLNNLEITTFDPEHAVTLACSGLDEKTSRINLIPALQAGLLQLVEHATQEIVKIPSSPGPVGRIEIAPKPSPTYRQSRVGLGIDSTDKFWKDHLQPGRTYLLRFSPDGGEAWCSRGSGGAKRLPVRREHDTVRFTVYADPSPPLFSAVFDVQPGTAHRSGDPPFKFVVDIASKADGPVTVCTEGTPFGRELNCVDQLVLCVDAETGEEVEFPAQFGCFDGDPRPEFPGDDEFVEVRPGEPWRFEYVLERESGSKPGGLESFESGRRYKIELSKSAQQGFGTWMLGRKEELLSGTVQERKRRWAPSPRGRGRVAVVQENGPVSFDVTE